MAVTGNNMGADTKGGIRIGSPIARGVPSAMGGEIVDTFSPNIGGSLLCLSEMLKFMRILKLEKI